MMVRIRDHHTGGGMIIRFDRIAVVISQIAATCCWSIADIFGALRQGTGMTIDEAYLIAEETNSSPWRWEQLCTYTANYFQIYDCEFIGNCGPRNIGIICFDSSYWEITGLFLPEAKMLTKAFSAVEIIESE